jgi:hypothetical protein
VYAADECFLTGSGAGIVAVAAIDGRELPDAPGPLTSLAATATRGPYAIPRRRSTFDWLGCGRDLDEVAAVGRPRAATARSGRERKFLPSNYLPRIIR